jgi:CopG family nickel-responsive transcriptional regulator
MGGAQRFGVSIENSLLTQFDRLIRKKGYENRSEAIRDLIRGSLVEAEWKAGNEEMLGIVNVVYDHHSHELASKLAELQHHYYRQIISTMHIHLDEHNCLEVLVLRGKGEELKKVGDRLVGTKGVKHGKIALTTTGKHLD